MLKSSKKDRQTSLSFSLDDKLDQEHPLYIFAKKVDWKMFEKVFSYLYNKDNATPTKSIRLMVGLLILKYLRNLSDGNLIEQWTENIYYQYFCGQQEFLSSQPCTSNELFFFRSLIGESGCELILKESIRINWEDSQENNITYPTDDRLYQKIIPKYNENSQKGFLETMQNLYSHT